MAYNIEKLHARCLFEINHGVEFKPWHVERGFYIKETKDSFNDLTLWVTDYNGSAIGMISDQFNPDHATGIMVFATMIGLNVEDFRIKEDLG